ncbi:MAG: RNA polymerase sigma factor FliA [Gammaproteobacteria bacterium]|nr:RNA polymerase sigma factor FliA [Gammaproteobacteria bacterium]
MNAYGNVASTGASSSEDLIENHVDLVKRIACHLTGRLPATVDLNDLLQAGMIGLLEAGRNFDPSRGASFETYAGIRIRGAMLDEVRKLDWTPRSVHQKHRQVSEAMQAIEAESGERADARAIAGRMGISLDEYHAILRDTAGCRLFSLEETLEERGPGRELPGPDDVAPDRALSRSQMRDELAESVTHLSDREQLVLSLYYERELNLKEIGKVLGVSESRVCQIHGQALIRLRNNIKE